MLSLICEIWRGKWNKFQITGQRAKPGHKFNALVRFIQDVESKFIIKKLILCIHQHHVAIVGPLRGSKTLYYFLGHKLVLPGIVDCGRWSKWWMIGEPQAKQVQCSHAFYSGRRVSRSRSENEYLIFLRYCWSMRIPASAYENIQSVFRWRDSPSVSLISLGRKR